jgi:hypothetical protein
MQMAAAPPEETNWLASPHCLPQVRHCTKFDFQLSLLKQENAGSEIGDNKLRRKNPEPRMSHMGADLVARATICMSGSPQSLP